MVDQGKMIANPIYRQMVEKEQVRRIGQIEEIGEEQGVSLMAMRSWEKACGSCHLVHRGDCY